MFCKVLRVLLAVSLTGMAALSAGAERTEDSLFHRAENALRDEARVLHQDFTSAERWRDWTLDRANGEDADIQAWMSSRWKETPGRLADSLAGSAAAWAGAGLRESEWVETLDFGFQLPLEGRAGWMNLNAIGPLSRGEDSVLGWQLPLSFGSADNDGETEMVGNVGLFYRRALGDWGLAGVNLFGDYQDEGANGDFWRWSVGAEYRTSWADVFVNRYIPSSPPNRTLLSGGTQERIAYSAGGYDAEVRFHAPRSRWLEGFAEYSLWEGEYGDADDAGFRYGFRLLPRTGGLADGFRFEADYDDTLDGGLGARFSYDWTLGQSPRRTGYAAFDPRAHLFSPVERRHEQEIRVRIRTLGINGAVARSESESDCSPSDPAVSAAQRAVANISLTMHVIAGDYDGVCGSLRDGANPKHTYSDGLQVLHFAATLTVSDALKIASVLVSASANVDAKGGQYEETPLHMAAGVDAAPMADFLIMAGADKNAKDESHYRPLHIAASSGGTAVIKVMLDREHPADVNANDGSRDRFGNVQKIATPLEIAITSSQEYAAIYLLAYNGECRFSNSHDWCDAEGLSLPVSPFSGGGTLAAAGYDGVVGSFSEVTSEVGKVTLTHSLVEGEDAFTNDGREVRAKNPLEEGERTAVMQVAASKGRLSTVFLTATFSVTVESGNDYTVTLSPYSRGAALTLESERFSDLEFEKSDGNVELTLSQNGVVSTTVNLRLEDAYTLKAEATVAGMLGTLRFSAEVYPSCESGALFSPSVSSGSFYGEILGNDLQRICWLISQGRDLNRSVFLGQGPLHLAAAFGRAEIASLLLFYGAEVNKLNVVGETPLDAGVSGGGAAALPVLVNHGGVCMQEENRNSPECGLRLWPRDVSVTVAAGYRGSLYALGAVPPEDGEVEYFLETDAPRNTALENGVVRRYAPLGGGDVLRLTVGARSGLQTLFADVKITALPEVPAVTTAIPLDHSGAVYTLALPGFENATYAAELGSAGEFTVAANGEVSPKENRGLRGDREYVVVARAEDAGFLGMAPLTLSVSVFARSIVPPVTIFAQRSVADGYSGVVLTISASAGEDATLSHGGELIAPFILVTSGNNLILSLTAALSGPDAHALRANLISRRAGFAPGLESAILQVTVLGPYSDETVIQKSESGEFYQFAVPGHEDAAFRKVSGSQNLTVETDGGVSRVSGAVLATQSVHNIVVSATDDGFLGESVMFTLDVSVSFCPFESTLPSEGATQDELDKEMLDALLAGNIDDACEWARKGGNLQKAAESDEDIGYYVPAMISIARDRNVEAMRFLLSGADIDLNSVTFFWSSLLDYAIWYDEESPEKLEMVKLLVSHGADVNNAGVQYPSWYGRKSPLRFAIYSGGLEMVEYLLSHGADPNARWGTSSYLTFPIYAASDVETMRLLVSYGADVDARNYSNSTRLYSAASAGDLEIVKYLISQGADMDLWIEGSSPWEQRTPLHVAAENGRLSVVEYLLSQGADINAMDANHFWRNRTPLYYAAKNLHLETVKYMLNEGADPNLGWYYTPLNEVAYSWRSRWGDRQKKSDVAAALRAKGAVCTYNKTESVCGLTMYPSSFTVTVSADHAGALHTVTANTNDTQAEPIYLLASGGDFWVDARTGELWAENGALAGIASAATVSIYATTEGGTQSVTVQVVVEVAADVAAAMPVMPDGEEHLNASAFPFVSSVATIRRGARLPLSHRRFLDLAMMAWRQNFRLRAVTG